MLPLPVVTRRQLLDELAHRLAASPSCLPGHRATTLSLLHQFPTEVRVQWPAETPVSAEVCRISCCVELARPAAQSKPPACRPPVLVDFCRHYGAVKWLLM
jgi:hypothetical protein